jgi:hypothetical protein
MNVAALVALAEKNPQGVITLAHAIVDPLSDKPELLTDAIGAATGGKLAVLGFAAKHPKYAASIMAAALDLFRGDNEALAALLHALRA